MSKTFADWASPELFEEYQKKYPVTEHTKFRDSRLVNPALKISYPLLDAQPRVTLTGLYPKSAKLEWGTAQVEMWAKSALGGYWLLAYALERDTVILVG